MHMSKVVLLWTRDPLALPAKMPLMLIGKKKTLPPHHALLARYKISHQNNPFNRVDRLGSSLAMHRIFKPIPSPSAPRSLDGHLASLERHDAASVESKDSTASRAKTDDMTPHKVLRSAFAPPAPLSVAPFASSQCGDGKISPVASMSFTPLPSIPIKRAKLFLPHGALPNGFTKARDLTAEVNANKLAVRGQSRFSRTDLVSSDAPLYLDSTPLPPADLSRSLTHPRQILLSGDGLPYPGFLRTLSIADIHGLDLSKLIGLVSFLLLPAFSPFQDEGPFLAHKTCVKNVVNMLRDAKKQNKATTVWLAYTSQSNLADAEHATLLDRCMDLIPSLPFLNLSIVCPVIHLAYRHTESRGIMDSPSPHDMPLIIFQLTSQQIPRGHVPNVVEFYPRTHSDDTSPETPLFTPTQSLSEIRLDVPTEIIRTIDGQESKWNISGSLPLMLLINGLSPDDSSTILHNLSAPRITKAHWPVVVSSPPRGL